MYIIEKPTMTFTVLVPRYSWNTAKVGIKNQSIFIVEQM
jgi:hypothetical protein